MADKYKNYEELADNEVEGEDYEIITSPNVLILAIHGGGIEPGTSELTEYVGKINNFSYYRFDGIKSTGNYDLHITATRFDEPKAVNMVSFSSRTVALHGYAETDIKHTYVGGLDEELIRLVKEELKSSGFSVSEAPDNADGTDPDNICNRNSIGKGVQIEISTAQRQAFFKNGDLSRSNRVNTVQEFYDYAYALSRAINRV
ncbi:poly-gamma-glutamate hydrolase family protein [Alteribacillus bidgolensis]|uniref:Phage-related replication protein YjqB, UPF0714/DUF867 family n=1 Tax=Alteribacillus bidgolensis TaxID=930129 RepID=A0A1G8S3Y0_9BACI|nr:poly-gamma-glutamate hydrolase family protein [Alteribacillus bidgolensis]SDJ23495.1 Phage-related replication protein YjqB, UPF0714/DUF867 family [Alteribacillus bidgolensis]